MDFFGSQFQYQSDEHIDATQQENGNDQNFERDVEIATIPEHQRLSVDATPFENTPQTPQRALNPEAVAFQPLAEHVNSHPTQYFQTVPEERRWQTPRTPEWRRDLALRYSPPRTQTLTSDGSHWQSNNPFALLSPDWTEPQQRYDHQQQAYTEQWIPQPISNQIDLYITPPNTGEYHGYGGANDFGGHQFGVAPFQPVFNPGPTMAGDGDTTLSSLNVSTLPTTTQPSENVTQWTLQSYNLGDRTRRESVAPPTPTRSNRTRGRGSTASSVSMNRLVCGTCGSTFEKRHEFEHHRRWHGQRPHSCGVCGKSFVAAKDLRRHMATHNKEERHIFCNIIGCKYHHKGFGRKDHLRRHIEKRHPGNLLSPPATSSFGGGG